jgi:hypothetical protein
VTHQFADAFVDHVANVDGDSIQFSESCGFVGEPHACHGRPRHQQTVL